MFQVQYYVRSSIWGDNSIGGLAKEAGFDEVYYADITTMSVWTYFRMERVQRVRPPRGLDAPTAAASASPR